MARIVACVLLFAAVAGLAVAQSPSPSPLPSSPSPSPAPGADVLASPSPAPEVAATAEPAVPSPSPSPDVVAAEPSPSPSPSPEPAAAEPAPAEPAPAEPAATEPAATEPAATEPAATEPAPAEPAPAEPAPAEPAPAEPAPAEPAPAEPAPAAAKPAAAAAVLPAAAAAAGGLNPNVSAFYPTPIAAIKAVPELSSLGDLANGTAAAKLLADKDLKATIFAPNNDAVDSAVKFFTNATGEEPSKAVIDQILSYHVATGASVLLNRFKDGQELTMADGNTTTITTSNSTGARRLLAVDDKSYFISSDSDQKFAITQSNIQGGKSMLHVIDGVLVPKALVSSLNLTEEAAAELPGAGTADEPAEEAKGADADAAAAAAAPAEAPAASPAPAKASAGTAAAALLAVPALLAAVMF